MRILHCTDTLSPDSGGPARSAPQLALAQAEIGHQVGIWTPQGSTESFPDLSSEQSSKIERVSGNLSVAIDHFGRPDVIHDHGIWKPCHRRVARFCKQSKIVRVVSPRGMLEPWALNHKRLKKQIAMSLYQMKDLLSADGFHATAESEANHIRSLGVTKAILAVPNGVSLPMIAHKKSGVEHERSVLFLSRIHPKKGLPLLVDAWKIVQPAGWSMKVVGPPEDGYDRFLKRQVKQAALEGVWSFEPPVEGPAKWAAMSKADLFVLPSYSENFGNVVAESLACGTPVITTTGTPWEGLPEHQCGWWVEPEVDELAAALTEAVALSDEERQEMGARGREWMAQDFTWPAVGHKTIQFYQGLIAERGDQS